MSIKIYDMCFRHLSSGDISTANNMEEKETGEEVHRMSINTFFFTTIFQTLLRLYNANGQQEQEDI